MEATLSLTAERVSAMMEEQALTREELMGYLRQVMEIRALENNIATLLGKAVLKGASHLYAGQEAVAVGAVGGLRDDDLVTSTHRGHGHAHAHGDKAAKTAEAKQEHFNKMMAEVLGRSGGYCKGKGGSMHIADFAGGNLCANGIVGGGFPIATGAGIGIQNRGTDQVVVCFFGDGAANQGTFHESLNLAALWKLPVLYVCENNQYALSTPLSESVALPELSERGRAYGIPGARVDGNDVQEVYLKAGEAVLRARAGEGPTILDCVTYRFFGHFTGDRGHGITYRSKEEMEQWRVRCPIARLRKQLLGDGGLTEEAAALEARVEAAIAAAARYGLESPWPSPEEALQDVFA